MSVTTASTEARRDRRRYQAETAAALAYDTPWTPAQDDELVNGTGTLAERARRIGRTYYAAARRLGKLRKELTR